MPETSNLVLSNSRKAHYSHESPDESTNSYYSFVSLPVKAVTFLFIIRIISWYTSSLSVFFHSFYSFGNDWLTSLPWLVLQTEVKSGLSAGGRSLFVRRHLPSNSFSASLSTLALVDCSISCFSSFSRFWRLSCLGWYVFSWISSESLSIFEETGSTPPYHSNHHSWILPCPNLSCKS